jgi:hypothetical protein
MSRFERPQSAAGSTGLAGVLAVGWAGQGIQAGDEQVERALQEQRAVWIQDQRARLRRLRI